MTDIDDPIIPDELIGLLRRGSQQVDVAPAELGSVQRRARQRRRRRHALVTSGGAVLVLLAGLVIAQVSRAELERQTVLSTSPPTAETDSVPQPLLVRTAPAASGRPVDPDAGGGTLVSVTSAGATRWWTTSGEWSPIGAYELADGRRFGVATTNSTGLGIPPNARLDQIGTDGTSLTSRTIPLEVPWGSFSASIHPVGVTGDEVILQRDVMRQEPIDDVFSKILTTTTYTAIDVDSGTERPLFGVDGTPGSGAVAPAAGAGDVLVRAVDGRCELVVSTLAGRDARTLADVCPREVGGETGYVDQIAVSPDGRYAAVASSGIDRAGSPAGALEIIDLGNGSSVASKVTTAGFADGISWTGTRQLTVAADPDQPAFQLDGGGITVRSVPHDVATGDPGD